MQLILDMFSYSFIVKALVCGLVVSMCCALLSLPLIYKRYSMIGDGLSHVSFGALSFATVLNIAPLYFSLFVSIIVATFLLSISNNSKIKSDAALTMVSTSFLAFGIFIISITKGINQDLMNYLFGTILAISNADMILILLIGFIVMVVYLIFYKRFFMLVCDEEFVKSTGLNIRFYNTLLASLIAVVIVIGMKIVGSLLISSLILFPCLSALSISKSYFKATVYCIVFSLISFIVGFIISYIFNGPSGPSIALVNAGLYLLIIIKNRVVALFNRI